tara:strand:- start:12974 stop:13603 length:630 start_codon:yes stop_codon:yes gene_type:complete
VSANKFVFKSYAGELKRALDLVDQDQLDNFFNVFDSYFGSSSNIFLLGNGGSQANAHHISGDFIKTFSLAGLKLKISCLADNVCHLTAASNDLSYDDAYAMLIDNLIDKKDLLIYLSGSGNSLNLVKCARKAKLRNIKQASLTGFNGGALNELVDYPIHIKFDDMEICEDIQLSIFHYIKQRLMYKYSENFENLDLPKYQKRTLEDLIS